MAEHPAGHPMEPDDPRLVAAARHALHDEEIVAAFAVDGHAAEDAAKARTLIERCLTCQELHADMVAIGSVFKAAGTAEAVAAVRPAPRDYRLTASDAVRLRGGNALQRAGARFLDGVAAFGRPVGGTLAAMGVVGLLVGSVSLGTIGLGGAPAAMPAASAAAAPGKAIATPAPGATAALTSAANPESTPTSDGAPAGAKATDVPREDLTFNGTDNTRQASPGPSLLFPGSIALLVAGLVLLVAGSRRRRSMPARDRART